MSDQRQVVDDVGLGMARPKFVEVPLDQGRRRASKAQHRTRRLMECRQMINDCAGVIKSDVFIEKIVPSVTLPFPEGNGLPAFQAAWHCALRAPAIRLSCCGVKLLLLEGGLRQLRRRGASPPQARVRATTTGR